MSREPDQRTSAPERVATTPRTGQRGEPQPSPIPSPLIRVSIAAGLFGLLAGAIVFSGWLLGLEVLKTFGGTIAMKANTSVAIALCGIGVLLVARSTHISIVTVVALVIGGLGGLTLLEHVTSWNLHIDQALFTEAPGAPATASPGRMGPNGALNFILIAVALWSVARGSARSLSRGQLCALISIACAIVPVIGYFYGVSALYRIGPYTGIAFNTAFTFLVLDVGILCLRTDHGPMKTLTSRHAGGVLTRQLLPLTAVVLVCGYLCVAGQRAGWYDTGFGAALFAIATAVILWVALWRTGTSLDAVDRDREAAARARDELLLSERAARESAEHASRLKDQFLAVLSHELRTPLNVIYGWARVLRSRPDPATMSKGLVAIEDNARLQARLVDDLLDVSRIASGRFTVDLKPLHLQPILEGALNEIAPLAQAKAIAMTSGLDGEAAARVDPGRLHQIVVNLLSNAIKFTEAGGHVDLSVRRLEGNIEIEVRDNGIGMAPEFLPHAFDRFRQADESTTRKHGGLGLGLAIVRDLTELHGGAVRATSEVGKGSAFTVSLPAVDVSSRTICAATTSTGEQEKSRSRDNP